MNKKLLVTAIALSFMNAASASSFLAGDPVEAVADKDTPFDNPAYLAQEKNQLTFSDSFNVGYIFEAFDQKLAVHAGRIASPFAPNFYNIADLTDLDLTTTYTDEAFNQLLDQIDLFWVGNMGFGTLGVRTAYGINNNTGLFANAYNGSFFNYTYIAEDGSNSEDDGTDTFSLEVDNNSLEQKSSTLQLEAGVKLNDMPIDGSVTISLPSFSSTAAFDTVEVLNTDGFTTTTERETQTITRAQTAESTGGLNASAQGRYKLNSELYITSGLRLTNSKLQNTIKTATTNHTNDVTGSTITQNETTTDEIIENLESGTTMLSIGADYRKFVGPAMFKIQPSLEWESTTSTTKSETKEDTFVDALDAGNNTTGAVGVTSSTEEKVSTISVPVNISIEYLVNEKWTWRAGTRANLLSSTSTTETTTTNKVNTTNDGYELDQVEINTDNSGLQILDFVNDVSLGFTQTPNDFVKLDGQLTTDTDGWAWWNVNFGITVFY